MSKLVAYLKDAVRHPHEKLSRGQHQVRYAWDLGVHCYRQLMRHRAEGMAAELTYRTIFSLIPVVVLGLVMFRIFGGLEEVQGKVENQLYTFFIGVHEIPDAYLSPEVETIDGDGGGESSTDDPADAGGSSTVPLTAPGNGEVDAPTAPTANGDSGSPDPQARVADTSPPPESQTDDGDDSDAEAAERVAAAAEAEAVRKTHANIRKTLHQLTSQIANIDFASIGVFGLLLFIYAAVALADSVEYLFNRIYDAPRGRPIHIRLAIHWSIITLGSGLLALSLYMSSQVLDWFGTMGAGMNMRLFLSHALSIAAAFVLLFLLYALMPNTHVSVRAAAVGAIVGALLWEAAKFGFKIYVVTAVPYSALYGSLGLLPLFLFWIYLTWLIVLFGLILTYTLQTLRGRRFVKKEQLEEGLLAGDPDWMLPIMAEIAQAFEEGRAIDNQELADRLGLSSRIVHEMTGKLVEAQILRKVTAGAGEEDSLSLARPADRISVKDILLLAHRARPTSDNPSWKTLDRFQAAEREAADNKTLADIALQKAG